VIAFVLFVLLRTGGDHMFHNVPSMQSAWSAFINAGHGTSQLLLTCGMTAVGLSVSFSQMRSVGWRPLAAAFAIATAVGITSLLLTRFTQSLTF
jgi:uncharacterized membrane protein YadS